MRKHTPFGTRVGKSNLDNPEQLKFDCRNNGLEQNAKLPEVATKGAACFAVGKPTANLRFDGAGSALPILGLAGGKELMDQDPAARI
jgi:hypothetical protein